MHNVTKNYFLSVLCKDFFMILFINAIFQEITVKNNTIKVHNCLVDIEMSKHPINFLNNLRDVRYKRFTIIKRRLKMFRI